MNKPNSVKVCSSVYDIEYVDNIQKKNGEIFGDVDWDKLKIRIATKFPNQRQLQTILHESIHVIEHEYQIKFDEQIIERLSNAIYALIIDNKELFKEIINAKKEEKPKLTTKQNS